MNTTDLPEIEILLEKITSGARREKYAIVESSVVCTPQEKKTIQQFLGRLLGHSVILRCRVNPDVLAGVRIQVGDWVVDTTLSYQLTKLAHILLA